MTTTAQKIPVAFSGTHWGGARRVLALPVAGYTHRWSALALGDPDGARIDRLPSTISPAADAVYAAAPTFAQRWWMDRASRGLLRTPTGTTGMQLRAPLGGTTIAGPLTIVTASIPRVTAGEYRTIAATTWWDGAATQVANVHVSNGMPAIIRGASSILAPAALPADTFAVIVAVVNGASSSLTVNGVRTTGTLPTGGIPFAELRLAAASATGGTTTAETRIGDVALFPGVALTHTEITRITDHLHDMFPA